MLEIILVLALLLLVLWGVGTFVLTGQSHAQYDTPVPALAGKRKEPSAEHGALVNMMQAAAAAAPKLSRKEALTRMRKQMDDMGENVPFDGEIRPVSIGAIPAEWVLAPGADPAHRLLYLHGGAFTMGSPKSHRAITTEYSRRFRVAVLAVDYRLMPEHPRSAAIEDCQAAYRWILDNGPDGAGSPSVLLISGDSAGGNLTLAMAAWARDQALRSADAVIALSPSTDGTFSSPTLSANQDTDAMLGPLFGKALARTPKWILAWTSLLNNRMSPANPLVSPLHADLAGLPPTLLHASTAEMLQGDSIRYYNKAGAAGSPVEIGLWPFMLHVWHAFVLQLPEAREAFDHIDAFVRRQVPALAEARPEIAASEG